MSTTNETLALSLTPATAAVQTSLFLLLTFLGVLGNGSICFFVLHFKSLRTIPNILLTNLAAIDLLNIIINVPLSMLSLIYDVKALRTKSASMWTFLLTVLFLQLNLASMLLLVVDRYLSLGHPMRYMTWKSRSKTICAICATWIWSVLVTALFSIPVQDTDLGGKSLPYYIKAYIRETNFENYALPGIIIVVVVTIVISSFTVRELLKKSIWKKAENNLQVLRTNGPRTKSSNSLKSACTIMIVLLVYIVFIFARNLFLSAFSDSNEHSQWYIFLMFYFFFCGSICNPFIYGARSTEFRKAWKEIFKLNKIFKKQVHDSQLKKTGKVFYINNNFGKKVVIVH